MRQAPALAKTTPQTFGTGFRARHEIDQRGGGSRREQIAALQENGTLVGNFASQMVKAVTEQVEASMKEAGV